MENVLHEDDFILIRLYVHFHKNKHAKARLGKDQHKIGLFIHELTHSGFDFLTITITMRALLITGNYDYFVRKLLDCEKSEMTKHTGSCRSPFCAIVAFCLLAIYIIDRCYGCSLS